MTTRIDQFSSPAAPDGGSGTDEINVWIIGDDEEVIVIDPGSDTAGVLDVVGDREVLAVICTHGHADHVAAAIELAERDEAPVALHPKDWMRQETTIAAAEKKFDSWVSAGPSASPLPSFGN